MALATQPKSWHRSLPPKPDTGGAFAPSMDFFLYLAIPIFVVGLGVYLVRRPASVRAVSARSQRILGWLLIGVGTIDVVIRILQVTVWR